MIKNVITAGIVNIGSGTVNAQGPINEVGKNELLTILKKLDSIAELAEDNEAYKEVSDDIKKEIEKPEPNKSLIRRSLQLIPSFLASVSSDIIANEVSPLVQSALSILGF